MTVGHQRSTQTRGVWLWSKQVPVTAHADATDLQGAAQTVSSNSTRDLTALADPLNLLFFDTEGFESTGQSGAYDDRIFAFAAIISSTLVYNLAEAVRESDIEKLSFAVELAAAFYPRYQAPGCAAAMNTRSLLLFVCIHVCVRSLRHYSLRRCCASAAQK